MFVLSSQVWSREDHEYYDHECIEMWWASHEIRDGNTATDWLAKGGRGVDSNCIWVEGILWILRKFHFNIVWRKFSDVSCSMCLCTNIHTDPQLKLLKWHIEASPELCSDKTDLLPRAHTCSSMMLLLCRNVHPHQLIVTQRYSAKKLFKF